jgi:galactose oxidase
MMMSVASPGSISASVTHCNNQSQSFLDLTFNDKNLPKLEINAPVSSNLATPGHYILFVLNKKGVPAIAPIIRLNPGPAILPSNKVLARHIAVEDHVPLDHKAVNDQMIANQKRPAFVLGLTPLCPYGLGPCWGGAYEALQHISDVKLVRPLPHQEDSLAFVYTEDDTLPDIDVWRSEFQQLAGNDKRPEVLLTRFHESSKIEWDSKMSTLKPMSEAEAGAHARVAAAVAQSPSTPIQVTGTLQKLGNGKFSLDVKDLEPVAA